MSKYSNYEMSEIIFGNRYRYNERTGQFVPYSRDDMWAKLLEDRNTIEELKNRLTKSEENIKLLISICRDKQNHIDLLHELLKMDEEDTDNDVNEEPKRETVNKLVRDRIPELLEKEGFKVNYRVLSKDEYKQALKDKLVEEVNEFLEAETKDEMREEIADIKEVLLAINKAFNLAGNGTNHIKYSKAIEKGKFDKRYFLESVEVITDKKEVKDE